MPPPHLGERSTHTPRAGSKTFSCRSAFIMVAVFVAVPLSLSRAVATATWQASRHAPRYRVRATASFLSSFPRPSHPLISSMGTRDAKSRPRPTFLVPCGAQNRRPGSVARWGASVATSPDKTLPSNPLRPPSVLNEEGEMAKQYDFAGVEVPLYQWWESRGFFKPIDEAHNPRKKKPFVIPMPPPNVTGYLHMGHAMFVALEDILTRFHRMRGRPTLWLPGTDHAGIATQMLVEKALAVEGIKRQELGREGFVAKVWEWKKEKGGYITQQMRRLGASADWSREKFTLDEDLSKSVVEAFVLLHEAGLIYRGDYLVNWSPSLQTAVSDLEVEYVEVEDGKLFFFKYPVANSDDFLPVATTRPETILGDTAVCVHPEDPRYQHLIGKTVLVPRSGGREIPIIADTYVDRDFGTGALKITPGHDPNDYELGKRHNLPLINIMNRDASINANGGQYQGMDRFECREALWRDMEAEGLALKVEKHAQRLPVSQRGGEVIEPLVSSQWFVKMDGMAAQALEVVRKKELRILPEMFEKVWYNWLENIHDWCISRQLWWGHRIPVWYAEGEEDNRYFVARSEEEALVQARQALGREDVTLRQDEDVLDTWFSSGLWPFATVGWPEGGRVSRP
uniref:valine--tRNA ligase n=1 Tax=Nannochloropsis gaditana (strain CCMP526) TaxID=1093141 RepID=I2CQT9_NANGC